jgi:16S rRNA (cytidine1402-2'-O)-methyltransferase
VIPIPGPNAAIAALSAAGCTRPGFLFYGFPPAQAGARRTVLTSLAAVPWDVVLYESPHRVRETLADMEALLGKDRELVIARELTKLFETIHRCALGEAQAWLDADPNRLKGEFVLIVQGSGRTQRSAVDEAGERALQVLLPELPLAQAVRLAARISGAKKNQLYQRALALKTVE